MLFSKRIYKRVVYIITAKTYAARVPLPTRQIINNFTAVHIGQTLGDVATRFVVNVTFVLFFMRGR